MTDECDHADECRYLLYRKKPVFVSRTRLVPVDIMHCIYYLVLYIDLDRQWHFGA